MKMSDKLFLCISFAIVSEIFIQISYFF